MNTVTTGAQNGRHCRAARSGVSTLMYAAQQGNVDQVRRILRTQSSALFGRDRTGKSALHYCSTSDNICAAQAADLLVMAAPDLVDTHDEDGFTPLHLAVIAGNMQLVTFLLANKADVTAVDNEKHSVVHWATVCGETAALRAVIAAGAPVSTPDVHGGYPLHYAAQMCGGDKDSSLGSQVLQTLLAHKDIKIDVEDGDKRQPLLWAASAGSAKAVLALVRAGAAVESADKDGLTALHCAASRGHTDCIDTLLTLCGASPDVIDSNGCTALHYAVTLGHADATALLLAHGADPNRQDRKGRSPAHCGCAKGQFETVKLISTHGANLWLRNARGDLPLHEAAASGRRELVRWLLEMRPSQVNARNNDGRTPIHMAALNDNTDMCKILLDLGAQINPILRTSKNVFMTPLDCALQRGFRSTAKYLQLQGGLPANRMGQHRVNHQPNPSALSLHIRDDVTFWGDTSDTEGEKELETMDRRSSKNRKLTYRKRSGEFETPDSKNEGSRKLSGRKFRKTSSKSTGSTRGGKSRLDYNNEIVINGRTEINIHQTKEIIVEKNSEPSVTESAEALVEIGETSEKIEDKRKVPTLRDQSTNTMSEDTVVTVIEASKSGYKDSEEKEKQIDQFSIISNTSDDAEERRDLVVEASVHPVPKEASLVESNQNKELEENIKEDNKHLKDIESITESKETLENLAENQINQIALNNALEDVSKDKNESEDVPEAKEGKIEEPEVPKNTEPDKNQEKKEEEESLENISTENKDDIIIKSSEDQVIKDSEPEKQLPLKDLKEAEDSNKIISNEPKNENTKEQETVTKSEKSSNVGHQPNIIKKDLIKNKESEKKDSSSDLSSESSESVSEKRTHKSFRILDDLEDPPSQATINEKAKTTKKKEPRSKSEETKKKSKSKIPTSIKFKAMKLSSSNQTISLPNINKSVETKPERSFSNLSAPMLNSIFSENEEESGSDLEQTRSSSKRKRLKKRQRREARSASDYESSNVIDSGFEPSPRSTRIPKSKNVSARGVNMSSVTQNIQSNVRRYQLERKIFQHLLELKRFQIRSNQHNEAMLVKRAIDQYHQSIASTVGAGRYIAQDYTFKSFEKFLYEALRKLQKKAPEYLRGLPETSGTPHQNPLLCSQSTNRCMHATHAYTGIPCAAYLPKMDHHTIPKVGFTPKPVGGFLPVIGSTGNKKEVTLELSHGAEKQIISLPSDRLDQNKRYYVTFTVKGQATPIHEETIGNAHTHAKSD